MDDARLARFARAACLLILSTTAVASCRLTESLDGFTDGEGGAATGGVGGTGAAGSGGFAGDSGGIGGTGDADIPDGSGGTGGTHTGGTGGTNSGGTGGADAGDAAPDGPSDTCASGVCSGSCEDCDGNSQNGCETDTNASKDHCGKCSHGCQGGACQSGVCQSFPLATGIAMPWGIVADEAKVYWVAEGTASDGTVSSISVAGTQLTTLASGQSSPVALIGDVQYLFWTTFASGGGVWRIEKSGTHLSSMSLGTGPQSLASDDNEVWWTNASDSSVRHLAKSGGSPTIMASGLNDPRGIAADPSGGKVYWTSLAGGEVLSANKNGTGQAPLATGEDHPIAITVDSEYVYWADAGTYSKGDCSEANGKIVRAKKADGANRTELATGQACPLALWVDDGVVYWTNTGTVTLTSTLDGGPSSSYNYDGAVMRWTTTVEAFEPSQVRPYGITTNSNSVFWTEQGIFTNAGAVKKRAK